MLFQSVEARFEGGEWIADFVGDAAQRAERASFCCFQAGLALHQFGSQRRDGVTVDDPANCRDQGQQQHDARYEDALRRQAKQLRCQKRRSAARWLRSTAAQLHASIGLGIEGVELRKLPEVTRAGCALE